MPITNNCEVALRRFRDSEEPRYLWIDSICIDQSDPIERASQVELMGRIYRHARKVLIFISDPPPDVQKDFEPLFSVLKLESDMHFNYSRCDDYRREFLNLLRYSWWSRIWVIQETLLNNWVELVFGGITIGWEQLVQGTRRIFGTYPLPAVKQNIPAVLQLALEGVEKDGYRLSTLLALTTSSRCTDPRDKVFALLSLARETDRNAICIDYQLSPEDLYLITTQHCIDNDGLLILDIIQDCTDSRTSWVPDFLAADRSHKMVPIQNCADHPFLRDQKAGWRTLPQLLTLATPGKIGQAILRLDGKILDCVQHIQPKTEEISTQSFRYALAGDDYCSRTKKDALGFYRQVLGIGSSMEAEIPSFLLHRPHDELESIESLRASLKPEDHDEFDRSCKIYGGGFAPFRWNGSNKDYNPYCPVILHSFIYMPSQYLRGRQTFGGKETIGICPKGVNLGDIVFQFEGLRSPCVLRKCQSGEEYVLIGPCCIVELSDRDHSFCSRKSTYGFRRSSTSLEKSSVSLKII